MTKGYPITPNCNNTDKLRCIKVWVPDCDAFLWAFWGQYSNLTNSWIWGGTEEQNLLASQLYYRAYLKTLDNVDSGCVDCADIQTELDKCKEELEQAYSCICKLEECIMCMMCNSSCGCNNSASDIFNPINTGDLDFWRDVLCNDMTPPSENFKCQAVNYIVDGWLELNQEFQDNQVADTISAGIVEWLIKAKNWTLGASYLVAILVQLVLQWVSDIVYNTFDDLVKNNRQSIINAAYNSSSPREARNNVSAALQATAGSGLAKTYWQSVNLLTNWDLIFDDTGEVPEDWPVTTPCEVTTPEVPEGYNLTPWPIDLVQTETYTDITIDPTENHKATIIIDNTAMPSSGMIAGWVMQDVGTRVGYLVQISNFSFTGNVSEFRWYNSTGFVNSVQFNSLPAGAINLIGRATGETGLDPWLANTPAQFQDNNMNTPNLELGYLVVNVASAVVVGQMDIAVYKVEVTP